MKFKKKVQLTLLQPLRLYKPTFRDCMKMMKVATDAVGPDLAKTPGQRVFNTKDADFIQMGLNENKELVINHVFGTGHDVPEIYIDYLGKIKSIVRRYIKGTPKDKNGVTKETVITKYIHKINTPKVIEQKPSKNKPYKTEIRKDKEGHVLQDEYYLNYRNPKKYTPVKRKETPDYLLHNLNIW